jgi:hypothetical protein
MRRGATGKVSAIAFMEKLDRHFTTLWDHGHIKLWPVPWVLLWEAGFQEPGSGGRCAGPLAQAKINGRCREEDHHSNHAGVAGMRPKPSPV